MRLDPDRRVFEWHNTQKQWFDLSGQADPRRLWMWNPRTGRAYALSVSKEHHPLPLGKVHRGPRNRFIFQCQSELPRYCPPSQSSTPMQIKFASALPTAIAPRTNIQPPTSNPYQKQLRISIEQTAGHNIPTSETAPSQAQAIPQVTGTNTYNQHSTPGTKHQEHRPRNGPPIQTQHHQPPNGNQRL